MLKYPWKYVLLSLFLCTVLPSSLSCESDPQSSLKALIKSHDVRIDFYGQVLDQQGRPVEGADVLIHLKSYNPVVEYYTEVKDIHTKTDKQGRFSISGKTGSNIFIPRIQKPGYQYSWPQVRNSFQYAGDGDILFIPDPNHPIIFRMRKMGESTFLLRSGGYFGFHSHDSDTEMGLDLIEGIKLDGQIYKTLQFNNKPVFPDLKVKATFDKKNQTWSVIIFAGTPDGGIFVSDELLYEAPIEGYQSSYAFSIHIPIDKLKPEKSKYIYYHSREPTIYSRLEIEDIHNVNEDHIDFGGKGVTNPYGDRNLEQANGIPGEVEIKLEKEVKTAFGQNRRPSKPDLPKLVQEWEKNRPLTEKVKALLKR